MRRILFITATRIGDAVLFSGPLAYLAQHHPEAEITVACGPLAAPLFRAAPRVSEVIVMAKRKRGGHWLDLWRRTVSRRWDLVVDLRGSLTSWFLRAGQRRVNRRKLGHVHRHRVVEAATVIGVEPAPAPQVWLDRDAQVRADALLPRGRPVLALSPAASAPFKEWSTARFAEAAAALTADGAPLEGAVIALFGGPGDEAVTGQVAHALPGAEILDLAGKLDLVEAAACLSRAELFIGNDSGLMHLSAAAGAPTLGLFGPTDERIYGPWGVKADSVRAGALAEEAERETLSGVDESLMGDLTAKAVVDAAQALLKRTGAAA